MRKFRPNKLIVREIRNRIKQLDSTCNNIESNTNDSLLNYIPFVKLKFSNKYIK